MKRNSLSQVSQLTTMPNTGGRPSHDYYNEGQFVRVKENGKYFSICKLCNTRLCTTAIERLKTHRTKCSTNTNDIDENDFERKRSYNSINNDINEDELLGQYDVVHGECILIPETTSTSGCKNPDLLNSIDTNLILPAKDVQSTLPVVSKKRKKIQKIENFLDKIENKDQLKIDESITEWLLSNNLLFNTVDNSFFKNFIKRLRPAYILPSTEVLSSVLLNRVYDKWILTKLSDKNTGILLITRYPNCLNNKPSFISVIFHKTGNMNAKYTFVDIIDINEISENLQEKMRDFICTSVEKVNEKNQSPIFAVVSDFDSFYIEDKNLSPNFWYIKSNLININALKEALTDTTFINKVKLLQDQFEEQEIQADLISRGGIKNIGFNDNNWDRNHNLVATCSSNFKFMRQIRSDENDYQFSDQIVQLLFDNNFRVKLMQFLKLSIRIYELIEELKNPESTIADMVEKWIQLYNKTDREEYKVIIDLEIKNFITPLFATANFLHPKYKGRALLDYNDKYMIHIREFICDNIIGEESLRVFTEYVENSGYFEKLIKITNNPMLFWSNVTNKQSMLQDFALNLLSIPPFTNEMLLSTSDCSINFDQEQSKKINELYHTLKINVL